MKDLVVDLETTCGILSLSTSLYTQILESSPDIGTVQKLSLYESATLAIRKSSPMPEPSGPPTCSRTSIRAVSSCEYADQLIRLNAVSPLELSAVLKGVNIAREVRGQCVCTKRVPIKCKHQNRKDQKSLPTYLAATTGRVSWVGLLVTPKLGQARGSKSRFA